MKKFILLSLVLAPLLTLAQSADWPFSDISKNSRFFIPVSFLKEQGLVAGYSDGAFHPEREVNRAEALAMILKTASKNSFINADVEKDITPENSLKINLEQAGPITIENLSTGEKTTFKNIKNFVIEAQEGRAKLKMRKPAGKKPFRDVSEKDWFYDMVKEAKRLGIVHGKGLGKFFQPSDHVTIAEALRMLFQSHSIQVHLSEGILPPDVAADAWYAKDMAYAVKRTLLIQQENGAVFPPGEELTRGQLALLLYRFMKNKEDASFGYASWYGDGLAKTKLTSGIEYAQKNLTAAHKTLPFGTIVRVMNMDNGKQVEAVINDRGPFVTGRIIDLSKSAFSALESPSAGIISVQLEVKTQ